ncbi:MAG: hypothetical protein H0V96_12635 [Acidimicrobiia bacterium]|nr:hypothetical protein [Acidimicrobiia bacterium]
MTTDSTRQELAIERFVAAWEDLRKATVNTIDTIDPTADQMNHQMNRLRELRAGLETIRDSDGVIDYETVQDILVEANVLQHEMDREIRGVMNKIRALGRKLTRQSEST